MAAIRSLPVQIISKVVSESCDKTYNLEISDESSCNSDVDILDLIKETTREPEKSVYVKNSGWNSEMKIDNLTSAPTLYNLSLEISKYDCNSDLKSKVVNMPPTVNCDFFNVNHLSISTNKENSFVTDSAIDDFLSTLTVTEPRTSSKPSEDGVDSNLIDFLEKTDVKCERINCYTEGSDQNHQQISCDPVSSFSLATLAKCHFRENLGSNQELKRMPDNVVTKDQCSIHFDDSKNDAKELNSHDEDFGISLSALAESFLRSETLSNCSFSSCTLLKKNDSEEIEDLDVLSFINSVNTTGEDCVKFDCSKENFSVKGNENCILSELLETKDSSDEGYDSGNLSPETDSNCVSLQTLSKKNCKETDEVDILSFINSVSNTEGDCVELANCAKREFSVDVKDQNFGFDELLKTAENQEGSYDSGKLSPVIDLNNCIKKPTTSSQFLISPLLDDDCSNLQPQDDSKNLVFAYTSTAKIPDENVLNAVPKSTVVNTRQSLFAKVLSCKYNEQDGKIVETVSNVKRKLFEQYFCSTERDLSSHIPDKKKVIDKSTESVIASGYLHLSALPNENC